MGKHIPKILQPRAPSKMPLDYFKRKFTALSTAPDNKTVKSQQLALVTNFKTHFAHYSRSQALVDSFMTWLHTQHLHDSELWTLYASYLNTNSAAYSVKTLLSRASLFKAVPGGLAEILEKRMMEEMGGVGTKDLAALLKVTKSEAIIRKIKEDGMIIVNNECDFGFFAGLFLPRIQLFPDVVDILKQQLERILPTIRNIQTFCNIAKNYSENKVKMDLDLLRKIENAILNSPNPLKELDINEVFLAFHSPAYYNRLSKDFWSKFEARVLAEINNFRTSWLLSTFARHNFPSAELLTAILPLWKEETTRIRLKEPFREGVCALTRYSSLSEQDKAWISTQMPIFKQQLSAFDVSTMLKAVAGAGWYAPVMWKLLLERFVVVKSRAKEVDKSMVYVAIRCMELDAVEIPDTEGIIKGNREELRTIFEKMRFPLKPTQLHTQIAAVLTRLQVNFTEFSTISELYRPNFTIPASNIVLICQDWPFHLCVNSTEMASGTKMMLRHLNKAGYKVLIVANNSVAEKDFEAVLAQAMQATDIANFQIV